MQEMQHPNGETSREVFAKFATHAEMTVAMNARRKELEAQGFKFIERRKIGRNEPCPCGKPEKFKRCCLPTMGGASVMRVEAPRSKP